MLRVLRIIGIVVFAALVAYSAHELQQLYQKGTLFAQYNSARKANITLLGVSVIALGALGLFELKRERSVQKNRHGYGNDNSAAKHVSIDRVSSSIYSAPNTVDAWQGRRTRPSKSRHKQSLDLTSLWMSLLRVCCLVITIAYSGLLAIQLAGGMSFGGGSWLLTGVLFLMALFSIVTILGVLSKKIWGLTCGYLLAIFNLLVFPFGTAAGLILLLGLVGATPLFIVPGRERRRAAREKHAKKMGAAIS